VACYKLARLKRQRNFQRLNEKKTLQSLSAVKYKTQKMEAQERVLLKDKLKISRRLANRKYQSSNNQSSNQPIKKSVNYQFAYL